MEAYLDMRVLIRRGRREGQKGIVSKVCADGTLRVDFPLGVGGGCEVDYYMPTDVEILGPEEELQKMDPFGTAYGPYEYHFHH